MSLISKTINILNKIHKNPLILFNYKFYRTRIYLFLFDFLEENKRNKIKLFGKKFFLNPKTYTGKILFSYRDLYENNDIRIIKKNIKKSFNIIDIGANVGFYSFFFLQETNGKIFAFEKDLENFNILKKNFFRYKNVQIFNKEVGTKKNQFRPDKYINCKIDLIKIDIDGPDYFALLACKKLISKYKSMILIEISENSQRNHKISYKKVFKFLKSQKYDIYDTRFPNNKINKIVLKKNEMTNLFAKKKDK